MFDFFKKKLGLEGLKKTLENTSSFLSEAFSDKIQNEEEFDDFILDDLEEVLIKADVGVDTAGEITDKIRSNPSIKPPMIKDYLKNEFKTVLKQLDYKLKFDNDGKNIYLVTGVNGAGKTTFIAKFAYMLKNEGKKVLLVAADTFRAAAEEQLDIWAKRAEVDIVRKDGAEPASLVYTAIDKMNDENYDAIIIDTAGRLQNKFNLMQELGKIKSVINKKAPEAFRESILVLDANTGQNGLNQAKTFKEAVDTTCVALTKLDGTAKGGIIIAVSKNFKLPVKFIGVGEKIGDLKTFSPDNYIDALFSKG